MLLYYVKDDLRFDNVQWYWDGATKENIDMIIEEQFQHWLDKFNKDVDALDSKHES